MRKSKSIDDPEKYHQYKWEIGKWVTMINSSTLNNESLFRTFLHLLNRAHQRFGMPHGEMGCARVGQWRRDVDDGVCVPLTGRDGVFVVYDRFMKVPVIVAVGDHGYITTCFRVDGSDDGYVDYTDSVVNDILNSKLNKSYRLCKWAKQQREERYGSNGTHQGDKSQEVRQ